MTSFFRRAVLVALPISVAAATLFLPVQAHDGHDHSHSLLRYPSGSRIQQVYSHPTAERGSHAGTAPIAWVQAQSEKHAPLSDNGCKLRPRLVAKLFGPSGIGQLTRSAREKLAIYEFDLVYDSMPIDGASRTVVVRDGAAVAIRDRNILTGMQRPNMATSVTQETAFAVAVQDSQQTIARLYNVAPTTKLVADSSPALAPRLVLWPDLHERKIEPAWHVTVRSTARSQPFLRRYWVSAHKPARVLDFEDQIFFGAEPEQPLTAANTPVLASPGPLLSPPSILGARRFGFGFGTRKDAVAEQKADTSFSAQFNGPVSGTVTAAIWETSPYRGVANRPLYGLDVHVSRGGFHDQLVRTDGAGRYQCGSIQGLATVRCTLSGHACRIINDQAMKDNHAMYSTRHGAGEVNVHFAAGGADECKLAQTSAYYHVTQAFEFVKDFVPEHPTKLPALKTHVNVNDSCNAYYDRSEQTLNFFRSNGTSCPNTAYRDVIYHEYGHAVDDELGGVLDGAYSEGFGDALSLLMTHSPFVAQDFYGPGKHLRDSRKVVYWPTAKGGEIHETGQVYSGFCYALVQSLQSTYPPERAYEIARHLILGAAVQNPKDIPDAVRLSFFVDSHMYPYGAESMHAQHLRAAARSRMIPVPQDPRYLTSGFMNW